jgi:hypothetical protein
MSLLASIIVGVFAIIGALYVCALALCIIAHFISNRRG